MTKMEEQVVAVEKTSQVTKINHKDMVNSKFSRINITKLAGLSFKILRAGIRSDGVGVIITDVSDMPYITASEAICETLPELLGTEICEFQVTLDGKFPVLLMK